MPVRISDKALTKKLDQAIRDILHLKTKRLRCFVCGRETDWFNPKTNPYGLQVGHYISRSVFALRWDLENCEPVCSSCNRIHEENILPHTQALLLAYGPERVDTLNTKWRLSKQKAKSFTRGEKRELLESLTAEIASLTGSLTTVSALGDL